MIFFAQFGRCFAARAVALVALLALGAPMAHAMEHITLANGFEIDCVRHEAHGDQVRLYLPATGGTADQNYMDIAASALVRVEIVPDQLPAVAARIAPAAYAHTAAHEAQPTAAELAALLAHSGAAHNIDTELLAAVVHAESGGHARAVSRTGALGLMQLMPGTAATLGVQDAFQPDQNVEGGTKYLDQMLTRYHDNIALALAAYNAGPGAVDRYHGVPPYRETQAYVGRILREFNQRKTALLAQAKTRATTAALAAALPSASGR